MVRGSRRILSLLGKVKVYPGGEMKTAKRQGHQQIGRRQATVPPGLFGKKQSAASQTKQTAQDLKPARNKKSGGMQRASVKQQPDQNEKQRRRERLFRISRKKTEEKCDGKGEGEGLRDPTRRRRPER